MKLFRRTIILSSALRLTLLVSAFPSNYHWENQLEKSATIFEVLGGAWPSLSTPVTGVTGGARVRCELQGSEDG